MSQGMPPPPPGIQGSVDRKRPPPPDPRATAAQQLKAFVVLLFVYKSCLLIYISCNLC